METKCIVHTGTNHRVNIGSPNIGQLSDVMYKMYCVILPAKQTNLSVYFTLLGLIFVYMITVLELVRL